jgi:hypothetical protein
MRVNISGSLLYNPETTNIIININNHTAFLTKESNPALYDILLTIIKQANEKPTS